MERHLRTAMYLMAMGLLFAASCSTRQAVPLGDRMQSWVGQPRDTLVRNGDRRTKRRRFKTGVQACFWSAKRGRTWRR
jgi:hypothetical protein